MKRKAIVAAALAAAMTATLITGCGKSKEAAFPDPEKTITLIVPQGAGGGTDTQARQLVEAMKEVSGNNNIIVENVTGGSTGTGTNQVIDSEADGYTLLMYGTYVICGTMTGYTDGFKELDFITGLSMEPFVLAVNADSPYQTLDDLIQAAKADSGKVTLGNAGATAIPCWLNFKTFPIWQMRVMETLRCRAAASGASVRRRAHPMRQRHTLRTCLRKHTIPIPSRTG